jgi:membrane associated rhomboid family serine protease
MFTVILIVIISLTSIIALNNRDYYIKGWFSPYDIKNSKQYYRFVTHIFLHASWEHLIFNMLTLYFFGMFIENAFNSIFHKYGIIVYILEFFLSGIIASFPAYLKNYNNPNYVAVGASGAVAAILFSTILIDPEIRIYIMFIPIGIPAYIFGPIYLLYSYFMSHRNVDNIAHDVHFWGSLIGFVFPLILKIDLLYNFLEIVFD